MYKTPLTTISTILALCGACDVACGPLPECSADPLADGADQVTWGT